MLAALSKGRAQTIIVNGMHDYIHAFGGLKPVMSISDLVRDMKNNSSNFVNDCKLVKGKFSWKDGYRVFSYSHSHIQNVYNYILNREKHHKKKRFKEEYLEFLRKFEVEYNEKYLFEWYNYLLDLFLSPLRGLAYPNRPFYNHCTLSGFFKQWSC